MDQRKKKIPHSQLIDSQSGLETFALSHGRLKFADLMFADALTSVFHSLLNLAPSIARGGVCVLNHYS